MLCAGDVADAAVAEQIVGQTIAGLGGLDILVNNAGIFEAHPVDEVSFEEWQTAWQRTLAVNLTGPANLCWCAVEHMRNHGGGRIVSHGRRSTARSPSPSEGT